MLAGVSAVTGKPWKRAKKWCFISAFYRSGGESPACRKKVAELLSEPVGSLHVAPVTDAVEHLDLLHPP
jgi:hypothetical protein